MKHFPHATAAGSCLMVLLAALVLVGQTGPGGYTGEGEVLVFRGSSSVPPNVVAPGGMQPDGPPTSYLAQPLLGTKAFRGEKGAVFGTALASGDINGDGFADLVVGAPGAAPIGVAGAGMAFVFYGSLEGWPSNISPPGSTHPEGPRTTYLALPIPGISAFRGEVGARFGANAVVADFDGDGLGDVAVCAPGYSGGRGIVVIFYGEREKGIADNILPPGNMVPPSGRVTYLEMPLVESVNFRGEAGAGFGGALAAGDVDKDGFADLVVGTAGASVIGVKGAGLTHIFYGSSTGIATNVAPAGSPIPSGGRRTILAQAMLGTNAFRGETGGGFGGQVAAGDLDGDGFADVIVSSPASAILGVSGAGVVEIFRGVAGGIPDNILPPGRMLPDPGVWSYLGQPWIETAGGRFYPRAAFGATLATGDINGDGRADLAIGAPYTSAIGVEGSGAVYLFYGGTSGVPSNLAPAGSTAPPNPPFNVLVQPWLESATKRLYPGAHFGAALAIGDVTGDRKGDLLVGAPESPVIGIENAGFVILWPGSAAGIASNITAPGSDPPPGGPFTLLTQPPFKAQRGEKDAHFGANVVTGDANRDGFEDIAASLTGTAQAGPERGAETTTIKLGKPCEGHKCCLDLIFVIDLTSSMSDDIDMVKKTAGEILDTIRTAYPDFRVAIVGYRDWVDSKLFEDHAFSSSEAEIRSSINSLTVSGGGDEPEAVIEALLHAIRTETIGAWRNGCEKQIVLMGDAPPHSPVPQGPDSGKTIRDVADAAQRVDPAVINSVLIARKPGDFNPEAKKAFDELAALTKGTSVTADKAAEVPKKMIETIRGIAARSEGVAGGGGVVLPAAGPGWMAIATAVTGVGCLLLLVAILALRRRRAPKREATGIKVAATLHIRYADGGTKTFEVRSPTTTIGRADDNMLVVRDPEVSAHHAVVIASREGFSIRDLGSTGGTFVGGQRVSEARLYAGSEIRIGGTTISLGQ